jgi:hypothetical protein
MEPFNVCPHVCRLRHFLVDVHGILRWSEFAAPLLSTVVSRAGGYGGGPRHRFCDAP